MIWISLFFGYSSLIIFIQEAIGFEVNEFLKIYIGEYWNNFNTDFWITSLPMLLGLKVTPEKVVDFIKKMYPKVKMN